MQSRAQLDLSCACCRDGVPDAEAWDCLGCGLRGHDECLGELRACPTPGCGVPLGEFRWIEATRRESELGPAPRDLGALGWLALGWLALLCSRFVLSGALRTG